MVQKCLLVLTACILGVFGISSNENPLGFKIATFEECQAEGNVPELAMKELFYFKSAEGIKHHKCVMKCINEKYGIYQNNGTFNFENAVEAIKELFHDPVVQNTLINAGKECVKTVKENSDACDYAYDLVDCFIKETNKEGVAPHGEMPL
ncbi:general odorant-binding protein 2 [Halyomorpha halys]|uniref:general odorant-binding protein 2 n=1 Tax=Halyomorpha halys TaxID=286706 RepID=UPI0006D4EC2E|nr:general odorant-binding protein 2 [Halyomorpha halys]KAE8573011.1 Odorant-binding protein 35 [Halyomorpha halys]